MEVFGSMKTKILAVLLCLIIGIIAMTASTLADNMVGLTSTKNDVEIYSISNKWYAKVPSAGTLTVSYAASDNQFSSLLSSPLFQSVVK